MKRYIKIAVALLWLTALFSSSVNAQVPGNDVPRIISYQGQVTTNDGKAMTGIHKISVVFYSDPHRTNTVWQGSYDAEIKNGIFSILLGSGKSKLPDNTVMNQPLWVGIAVDGSEEMKPLTQLAATPYALNVPDKSITSAKLADDVLLGMGKVPTTASASWDINGNTIGADSWIGSVDAYAVEVHVDDGGATNSSGRVMRYDLLDDITGGHWSNSITGDASTIAGGGYRSGGVNHPNTIGTYATSHYSFLGGGRDNELTSTGGVLGGGERNTVIATDGSMAGGYHNRIGSTSVTPSPGNYSFIGGGSENIISTGSNTSTNDYSAILGGSTNTISPPTGHDASFSSILSGSDNTVKGTYSSILGGEGLILGNKSVGFLANSGSTFDVSALGDNLAFLGNVDLWLANDNSTASKLKFFEPNSGNFTSFKAQAQSADIDYTLPAAQGAANTALTNGGTGTLSWSDISGLGGWSITGNSGTTSIGNGGSNYLGTADDKAFEIRVDQGGTSTQGRRRVMRYDPNNTSANITGGFNGNIISAGVGSFIGGGGMNTGINEIQDDFGVITGGDSNKILSHVDSDPDLTFRNLNSFIGAGRNNLIQIDHDNDEHICVGSAIVAGFNNTSEDTASFIGAGSGNEAEEAYSAVVGGKKNKANGDYSFIGSGESNQIAGFRSSIVGGLLNESEGNNDFIGGGANNFINTNTKNSSILGGLKNSITTRTENGGAHGDNSVISGGALNVTKGSYCSIPGGDSLIAKSYCQTVIGHNNAAKGGSTKPTALPVTTTTDPLFIIGNGAPPMGNTPGVPSNAFEVYDNGTSIVYNTNGSGAVTSALRGGTYTDNTILAWADVDGTTLAPTVNADFGVTSVTRAGVGLLGQYIVTLFLKDPATGGAYNPANISVQVSIVDNTPPGTTMSTICGYANVSQIGAAGLLANQFLIRTYDHTSTNCTTADKPFMFTVTGR